MDPADPGKETLSLAPTDLPWTSRTAVNVRPRRAVNLPMTSIARRDRPSICPRDLPDWNTYERSRVRHVE